MPENGFNFHAFYIDGTTILHVGHFSVQEGALRLPHPSLLTHISYCPICNVTTIVPFCLVSGIQFVYTHALKKNLSQVQLTLHSIRQHSLFYS